MDIHVNITENAIFLQSLKSNTFRQRNEVMALQVIKQGNVT